MTAYLKCGCKIEVDACAYIYKSKTKSGYLRYTAHRKTCKKRKRYEP